tara:strand:+ start:639 stop:854 length:216 start_codon:yes stop_codon:yes gene_type:complete
MCNSLLIGRFGVIRGGILLYYALSSKIKDLLEPSKLLGMARGKQAWGHSSAGRAPAWHAGGQRFESAWLHL